MSKNLPNPISFSKRKPLPVKPRDYKPQPPSASTSSAGLPPSSSKVATTPTHSSYLLTSNPLQSSALPGTTLLKDYPVSSASAYTQFESLVAAHLSLQQQSSIAKDSPRLLLASQYAASPDSFKITRPAGVETLQNNLTVLGKKRIFGLEDVWQIISDVTEAVRDLNESQMAHLCIKPENVVLCDDKTYRLTDVIFNEYVMQSIKKEETVKHANMLEAFPHMTGKTEHTVVIFNKSGNEYINTKNAKHARERNKTASCQKTIGSSYLVGSNFELPKANNFTTVIKDSIKPPGSPYTARECLEELVLPMSPSDDVQKADSFSIAVLFHYIDVVSQTIVLPRRRTF